MSCSTCKHGLVAMTASPCDECYSFTNWEAKGTIKMNTDTPLSGPLPETVVFAGQADPDGKDPHQKGAKLDAGKLPTWQGLIQYFPRALEAVAAISEFGSRKYTWGGWKTVKDGVTRYTNALLRHLFAEAKGELYDPETNMLHAAHAAWNANARLEKLLEDHPLRRS